MTLGQFIVYCSERGRLAYAALFLAAFLEAIPVIGTFVPGSTVILGLSALVATGDLSLVGVFAAAISGAAR